MHQLYVCTELNKRKLNLEILFTAKPSIRELIDAIEEAVRYEQSIHEELREGGGFAAHRLVVWDKPLQDWLDLYNHHQLDSFTQIYAFQEQAVCGRAESPGDLPMPRPITFGLHMPKRPKVVVGL
eukprot:TRINITY_DN8892_c0_g1_i2.p1 TRINITY_DN8892_c0_g1~~TRINITY_DN8892_c0_g1_i2.p1  ORF type:complete len:125 (+),score=5.10 TRINITY_DN8892_c0_g1_i2:31-405(+)